MPKVSVIIPTYNRAHLLERAIRSVLNQTFQDFELIVVDDASTDETDRLINNLGHQIRYIRHDKNRGASAARNTGIKHSSGDYIAFLDSDDEWLPEKLEKQIKVFENRPDKLGLVYVGYSDEIKPDEPIIPQYRGDILYYLLINNYVGSTTSPLVRKICFERVGFFDESLPALNDWDMWIRIAQHYEFEFIPEVLARFHLQLDSISNNIEFQKKSRSIIFRKYNHLFKNLPKNLKIERYFWLGQRSCWYRNIIESLKYFTLAIVLKPSIIIRIINFYTKKLFKRLKEYM
jgi:glycosyltransferase involved in cell wall biosynthesis